MTITGHDLIGLGYKPGPWFKEALELLAGKDIERDEIHDTIKHLIPPPPIELRKPWSNRDCVNLLPMPETADERDNNDAVWSAMQMIMRVPTVVRGAIMPDACPAGTIPVGGVVATKDAIHPGYHSADVCCSMAITVLENRHHPKLLLDTAQELTHFGPTKRMGHPAWLNRAFVDRFKHNPFLAGLEEVAQEHYTTQGDGNHFYFIGRLESTGELAIVSHHGSRGFGAQVYKRGLAQAQRETKKIAPSIPKAHAWLDTKTELGQMYWRALQVVRQWTRANHFSVHNAIVHTVGATVTDRFWNPHNFVFQRGGLFYHAKGATPSYDGHSLDDDGRTLIPMNMAEPILITRHTNQELTLGFAPHGAGRNMSRTRFLREHETEIPEGIDVRFWCGNPDPSELPAAYKNSGKVIAAIKRHQSGDHRGSRHALRLNHGGRLGERRALEEGETALEMIEAIKAPKIKDS